MRTRYWDWTFRLQEGPQYLRFCGTAPVSHIFGFREALRMIEEEGLEAQQRHAALASAAARSTRSALTGCRCSSAIPPIAATRSPRSRPGGRRARLSEIARDAAGHVELGLLDLAGRAFRIAHMGHVSASSILGVLGVVEATLLAIDAPNGGSGVAAAAASIASHF